MRTGWSFGNSQVSQRFEEDVHNKIKIKPRALLAMKPLYSPLSRMLAGSARGAFVLSAGVQAGEVVLADTPEKTVDVSPRPVAEDPLCCRVFDPPALYNDEESPYVQGSSITHRYQYYYTDANTGLQPAALDISLQVAEDLEGERARQRRQWEQRPAKRRKTFTGPMVATLLARQGLHSGTPKQQHTADLPRHPHEWLLRPGFHPACKRTA